MSTGSLSGVASSSSLQILMVLSTSQVIRRVPVRSKVLARMPASLSSEPGLHDGPLLLEAVARLPVAEAQHAVVAAGEEHTLLVDAHGVQDVVVPADVHQEVRLRLNHARRSYRGALPLLDVVRGRRGEHVLPTHHSARQHALGVEQRRAHALLVVGEDGGGLARHQVPRPHRRVRAARHHLRLARLRGHAVHGGAVAAQHHDLRLRADVPHAADAVAAAVRITSSVGCVAMQYTPLKCPW